MLQWRSVCLCVYVCKKALLQSQMSVMTPKRPESPRSAALTAEKQENGQTREARDGDKGRQRDRENPWKHQGRQRERWKTERERESATARQRSEKSAEKERVGGGVGMDAAMGACQPAAVSSPRQQQSAESRTWTLDQQSFTLFSFWTCDAASTKGCNWHRGDSQETLLWHHPHRGAETTQTSANPPDRSK